MISKFVGQGEGYLREMFRKARLAGKSIIFFDEVDAVAGKRLVSYFFICAMENNPKNYNVAVGLLHTVIG